MSSLQHRASKRTTDAASIPQNHNRHSFSLESCFSALATDGNNANINNHGSSAVVSASADLAQMKMNAAAKRNREEKEEAALERRVAVVVDSAKYSSACSDDHLGSVVPRALHPNNAPNDWMGKERGEERDNNFVQFQDGAVGDNGFLSSLVSSHKSEGQHETMSHKSRTLLKNKNISRKQQKLSSSSLGSKMSSRRQEKHSKITSTGGKKIAKKSRKSKY